MIKSSKFYFVMYFSLDSFFDFFCKFVNFFTQLFDSHKSNKDENKNVKNFLWSTTGTQLCKAPAIKATNDKYSIYYMFKTMFVCASAFDPHKSNKDENKDVKNFLWPATGTQLRKAPAIKATNDKYSVYYLFKTLFVCASAFDLLKKLADS
jgi:hypothetical protein